jgi:hypothetical protein
LIRFFVALLLVAALLVAVMLAGTEYHYFSKPTFFYKTLVFLLFGTAVIYAYLYTADKPGFFLQLYLLTMVVKLLAYCGYALVMIRQDRAGALANVVFFMIAYFLFTFLEIGFLYHRISGKKPS